MAILDKEIKVIAVKGERGYSSYEEAVKNGLFVGTLEEWINSFSTPENYVTNTTFQNAIQNLDTNKLNKNSINISDQIETYITNENGILIIKTVDGALPYPDYTMELKFIQGNISLIYKEYEGGVPTLTKGYSLQSYLDKVDTNANDIDTLESNIETLESNIETLENSVGTLEDDVDNLENKVSLAEELVTPQTSNFVEISKAGIYALSFGTVVRNNNDFNLVMLFNVFDLSKNLRMETHYTSTSDNTTNIAVNYYGTNYSVENVRKRIVVDGIGNLVSCKLIREY